MNALKSLGKLVWGSQPDPESARLSSGVFYHTNPGAKVARKCLYKDSELSICRTDIKYQFLLIVQQVFADGEEELEDSDDLDNEHEFLIADELRFTAHVADGFKGFRWVDPDDPSGRAMYEFIIEDSKSDSKLVRDCFARAVAHCVWERKNERPYTQASEADIDAIASRVEEEELEKMLNSVSISDTELQAALADAESPTAASPDKADDASSAAEERKIKSPAMRKEKHKKANKYDKDLPPSPDKIAFGDITVSVIGALYLFDSATESFVEIDSSVALSVIETGKFTYYINVIANDRDYVSQLVEPSMNAIFNHDHLSLIWNYFTDSRAYSFSLAASDESHYNALHQGMTKAAYETLNKVPWSKVSVSSQDYLLDAYEEDLEMAPVPETWSPTIEYTDNESDDESDAGHTDQSFRKAPLPAGVKTGKPEKEEDSDKESHDAGESDSDSESDEDEDDEDDDDDDDSVSSGDGAKNSILEIGRKHGRSFVVRGSRIGVFKHTDSDGIQFATNINNIDDTHGNRFTPSSTMLHEGDSSMVLMNQDRPNDLFKMDLEYGKVVEEWKVHEDIPTVSIAPTTKYSQMTGEKTLVGLSHNMLYRIDPRIGGKNMIVEKDMQTYAGKNKFSALATTMTGAIVIGNAKGEIRMYDRLGVRSKTTLPALGDPIIGIDVTSDGRYIVATCSTYLLLIDVLIPDDPTGRTGFVKPFPQDKKPAPRRLQLKPEHVVYMGGPPSFTPAKFNQSPSGKASERTIVTSTGPFVVTWNLRRALGTGRGDAYHIKQYSQHVVADNFRFGHDRSIVVALPDDVKSVKRSQLARPTRESLMICDLSAASSDAA